MPDAITTIYVVNWEPVSVGGFEWRRDRSEAETFRRELHDATAQTHVVKVPDHLIYAGGEAITDWVECDGWSDGGDPREGIGAGLPVMTDQMTTPLGQATGQLRDRLIDLAERHQDDPRRPCCDAETTLADWIEAGFTD